MARAAVAKRKSVKVDKEALYEAQDLIYEAYEARTAKQQIALAKKALQISPFCADAYVMLAKYMPSASDEALDFWQRGVEVGKKALGADFNHFRGSFWGFIETRPYMRARAGLAFTLWERGAHDEAIDHLQAMLALNPNDNQGLRYILAAWLLEMGRDDELAELLKAYEDDGMAAWTYTTALAAFRKNGDTKESQKLLADALASNKHVPAYLLGEQPVPETLPPYISPGQTDEAAHYVTDCQAGWTRTPGAIDWLREQIAATKPKRRSASGKAKKTKA